MEYLPTDLPKYMKTTSREAVANSPVEAGHVLLFSEDGTSLTAKKSDGSFESVGGGSNVVAGYIRNINGALIFCEAGKMEGGAASQITVSGAGSAEANGKYTTTSAEEMGIKRVWTNASTGCKISINANDPTGAKVHWEISNSNGDVLYRSFSISLDDFSSSVLPSQWLVGASGTSPVPGMTGTVIYPTGSVGDTVTQLRISETLKPAPDYVSGGSSSFYKCSSVTDLTLNTPATWSGYKALYVDGKYTFSDTETTGLTYTIMKPVVGGIYTADALVKIQDMYTGLPADGLMLYVPFNASNDTASTGQNLTMRDPTKVAYTTYKGIACVKLNGTYIIAATGTVSTIPMTVSVWAAPLALGKCVWCSGNQDDPMMYYSSDNIFRLYSPDTAIGNGAIGDWHHLVWSISSDSSSKYYFDGVAVGSVRPSIYNTMNDVRIGYRNSYQPYWNGYLAGFRIYNRAVSAAEVAALYAEYTPTAE